LIDKRLPERMPKMANRTKFSSPSFRSETKERLAKFDYHDVSEPVEWLLADNSFDVNREAAGKQRPFIFRNFFLKAV
jgi:hypothetical protein